MVKSKKSKDTPAEQSARFKETARKLGADEKPETFERILKKAAKKGKAPR